MSSQAHDRLSLLFTVLQSYQCNVCNPSILIHLLQSLLEWLNRVQLLSRDFTLMAMALPLAPAVIRPCTPAVDVAFKVGMHCCHAYNDKKGKSCGLKMLSVFMVQ